MTNSSMVELVNLSSRIEADPLTHYLRAQGIDVYISSDDVGGLDPALAFVQGVSVQVPPDQLVKGKLLLEAWRQADLNPGWEDLAATVRIDADDGGADG